MNKSERKVLHEILAEQTEPRQAVQGQQPTQAQQAGQPNRQPTNLPPYKAELVKAYQLAKRISPGQTKQIDQQINYITQNPTEPIDVEPHLKYFDQIEKDVKQARQQLPKHMKAIKRQARQQQRANKTSKPATSRKPTQQQQQAQQQQTQQQGQRAQPPQSPQRMAASKEQERKKNMLDETFWDENDLLEQGFDRGGRRVRYEFVESDYSSTAMNVLEAINDAYETGSSPVLQDDSNVTEAIDEINDVLGSFLKKVPA